MMKEYLKIKGEVALKLTDKDGNVKQELNINNLITNSGLSFITSRMIGTDQNVMAYMAMGSGTTAASAGDTTLGSQLGNREALDSLTANVGVVTHTSTFEAGDATGAITEAGIFNAASGGQMLARTVFPAVNKSSTDTLAITWVVTISV
jgi:hypothetical protein